ncbi:MAG: HAMP domain-containing protein [Oxalobacteraceae bacterium]|jgi:nitrogen fixation/metabolism regulation signal transduction histidine kinase|nr:HAMP domain-containing protein [Oxalobacteraceae bacterium]
MRRALRYLLLGSATTVGVLLFLLAVASGDTQLFDSYYSWVLGANVVVGVGLLAVVLFLLARLYSRYRRGRFGSRLMARMVLNFAMMGIVPGIVIYLVSVQFVSRSIESWFNVKVESALESGLNLGRAALESSLRDLQLKAAGVSEELADMSDSLITARLPKIIERNQLQEAIVVSASGKLVASSNTKLTRLLPELPTPSMLARAHSSEGYGVIDGMPDADRDGANAEQIRLRVIVPIRTDGALFKLRSDARYLLLVQPVPEKLFANAEALRVAYSEYQERSLARAGLRKFFLVTLTLVLLLAVFAAMVSAFLLASDFARPLLLLAEGTQAVAEGNLSPRPIVATPDELGTLTQSFNMMTMQLSDAREAVERNRHALEDAKAYLESVLANMSAGVMVFDEQWLLVTFNASAKRILRLDLKPLLGQSMSSIVPLAAFREPVMRSFSRLSAQAAAEGLGAEAQHWQQQIEIPRKSEEESDASDITLLARGSHLPVGAGRGYIIVFDDISDVISGQRSIAWAEVARRLAHEIKNPLTPIQLSAERLHMKLQPKLTGDDAALLERGTNTIVNQVVAMQQMVDNFRDYAKTPPPLLQPLDLNGLISEILELYSGMEISDAIQTTLQPNLPIILGDATQMRQVVHNLLQNAQDAVADIRRSGRRPEIRIVTEAFDYADADGQHRTTVRLTVSDNGQGFDPALIKRAFEPYVTSKPKGTGLGLPVVKKIIEEHGGRIEAQNRKDGPGAKVLILLMKLEKYSV